MFAVGVTVRNHIWLFPYLEMEDIGLKVMPGVGWGHAHNAHHAHWLGSFMPTMVVCELSGLPQRRGVAPVPVPLSAPPRVAHPHQHGAALDERVGVRATGKAEGKAEGKAQRSGFGVELHHGYFRDTLGSGFGSGLRFWLGLGFGSGLGSGSRVGLGLGLGHYNGLVKVTDGYRAVGSGLLGGS